MSAWATCAQVYTHVTRTQHTKVHKHTHDNVVCYRVAHLWSVCFVWGFVRACDCVRIKKRVEAFMQYVVCCEQSKMLLVLKDWRRCHVWCILCDCGDGGGCAFRELNGIFVVLCALLDDRPVKPRVVKQYSWCWLCWMCFCVVYMCDVILELCVLCFVRFSARRMCATENFTSVSANLCFTIVPPLF